jgi:ubiquinone/menaquinone biosynthesis C-methylase UbiE
LYWLESLVPRRQELTELMDDPGVDRAALARSLRFIRRVNGFLGGSGVVVGRLRKFSRGWEVGEKVTLLDVATGSADIPLAILRWAGRRGFDVRIVGLDLHATTLALAREHIGRAVGVGPISFVRGDALALPFADRSVDYVTCSMFLHHLTDEDAARAVREMLRVARRGVILNDLRRTAFARIGIFLLTLFADRIDKHDARVSVQKAWTRAEVEPWRAAAPWLTYHEHAAARFTLAGERPECMCVGE